MGLTVTVLGCSGSDPGAGGACSGYLVSDGETTVWLDAGSGTLANLQREVDPAAVDAVVLSHEHPDHWSDVEGFHNVLRFALGREGVPVFAPAGLRRRTYGDTAPWLVWNDVADRDRVDVGTLTLTFSRTDHPPETLAVRVDSGVGGGAAGDGSVGRSGGSVAYSADTGPRWSMSSLGEGIDLALCEATLPASKAGSLAHLTAAEAGATARDAGVGRLVLTHLWPTLDPEQSRREGSEAFGAPVEVASVGARYET